MVVFLCSNELIDYYLSLEPFKTLHFWGELDVVSDKCLAIITKGVWVFPQSRANRDILKSNVI